MADSAYDVNRLYAHARSLGFVLVAFRKRPGAAIGHRTHHADRLGSVALTESAAKKRLVAWRLEVERASAWWGCFAGGLGPLPRFVRRPCRVTLWVAMKLLIAGVRHHQRRRDAA